MIRLAVTQIHTGTRLPPRIGPERQNRQPLPTPSSRVNCWAVEHPIHHSDCGLLRAGGFGQVIFDERLLDGAERGGFADLLT